MDFRKVLVQIYTHVWSPGLNCENFGDHPPQRGYRLFALILSVMYVNIVRMD